MYTFLLQVASAREGSVSSKGVPFHPDSDRVTEAPLKKAAQGRNFMQKGRKPVAAENALLSGSIAAIYVLERT